MIEMVDGPTDVIWDVTYACPLRCFHCYSESGRRATRQLDHEGMLRVADALISLRPGAVALAGGEPLLVKGILEVAQRLSAAGVEVILYTSGWLFDPAMLDRMSSVFTQINISVDGATAQVHDYVRRRPGSFERAMAALRCLDEAARDRRRHGKRPLRFGIDCVLVRSNFHQLEEFCSGIAPRFPELEFIAFGAAVPAGLASRSGVADHELLTDEQLGILRSGALGRRLRQLAPGTVRVTATDNYELQMHPDDLARPGGFRGMQVEPDGEVRAMPIYEGTVGNLLSEPPMQLWQRAVQRWSDPFVTSTLGPVRSMREWAAATRQIDYHFGSQETRARIDKRPAYTSPQLFSRPA